MLIDCDTCRMREIACGDCVITLLLGAPDESRDVSATEMAAFGALAAGGLVPPLRLVPMRDVSARSGAPASGRPEREGRETASRRWLPPAASGP